MESENLTITPSTEPGFDLETAFDDVYNDMPAALKNNLDYYFRSYSNVGIHDEMLSDFERTAAYRRAILRNHHLFKDKVVLDVGCGTGILSMFAASAGAKHVYAIDLASITIQATKNVAENGFADKITVINGKMEELELPVDKVDIIISEWMGYCLLYESMLDSILVARDKYLVEGGMIFPDRAKIYISTLDDPQFYEDKSSFWDDVYGISMRNMKEKVLREGYVDFMNKETVNSTVQLIADIDIEKVKIEDLDFVSKFDLKITRYENCNGFLVWFDCDFTHGIENVCLSTSPFAKYTHWKNTIFYMDKPYRVKKGDRIQGYFGLNKHRHNPRYIDVVIKAKQLDNMGRNPTNEQTKLFEMQ